MITPADNRRRLARDRARPEPKNGGAAALQPQLTGPEIYYLQRLRRFGVAEPDRRR